MAQDRDRAAQSGSYGTSRWVMIASLIGLVVAGLGVKVLIDPQGGQNILAWIYDATGNPVGATGWVTAAAPLERIPVYLREGGSLTDLRAPS